MSFSLKAVLGLDAAGFESGLLLEERAARASGKKISDGLQGGGSGGMFGHGADGIIGGAAALYAVDKMAEGFKKAIDRAHELRSISQDIGSSVENVQVYAEAFGGTEHLTTAFKSMAEAREKALGGGADAQKFIQDFGRLGVTMDDLRSKNMDQIFQQIGTQVKGATVDGRELADVSEVLGKSGVKMIDGFKRGVTELHEEMLKHGDILTAQDIKGLEDAHRAMGMLENKVNVFFSHAALGWSNFITHFTGGDDGTRTKQIDVADAAAQVKAQRAVTIAAAQADADAKHKTAMETVAAINAETAALAFRELSNDERRVALAAQRKDLEAAIVANKYDAATNDAGAVLGAQLRQQLEQVKLDQSNLKEDKTPKTKEEKHHEKMDVNAAQRVGAYAYQAAGADVQKAQAHTLTQIHGELVKLNTKGWGHF